MGTYENDRRFVHAKWQYIRPRIRGIAEGDDISKNPTLREQIIDVQEPIADLVTHCREINTELFDELCERVTEVDILTPEDPSGYKGLSAKTVSQLYFCMRLLAMLPGIVLHGVIEIGGGLGNMAKLLLELEIAPQVHIIDLPEMLAVQRAFFRSAGIDASRVRWSNIFESDGLSQEIPHQGGVLFSSFGLTEIPADGRAWVAEHVAPYCNGVYIIGQSRYYGDEDIEGHICELLSQRFDLSTTPGFLDCARWPSFELIGRSRGNRLVR